MDGVAFFLCDIAWGIIDMDVIGPLPKDLIQIRTDNIVAEHDRQVCICRMVSNGEFLAPIKTAYESLTGQFRAGVKRSLKKQFKEILNG